MRRDFKITGREVVELRMQLCRLYPGGPFTGGKIGAYATPVFSTSFDFQNFDPYDTATPAPEMVDRYVLTRKKAGDNLCYMTFVTSPFTNWTEAPLSIGIPLATSLNNSTGVLTVYFPFGSTFNPSISPEWRPGASPRRYQYWVYSDVPSGSTSGDKSQTLVEGFFDVGSAEAPAYAPATSCKRDISISSDSVGASSTSQPSSPWLVG